MSVVGRAEALEGELAASHLLDALDRRTRELLERRAQSPRRGWLVRRALLAADVLGLFAAFVLAERLFDAHGPGNQLSSYREALAFVISLPGWIVLAKLHGLYERDEERADHSTVDDFVGVVHVVTLGAWSFFVGAWATGLVNPDVHRLVAFWALGILLVALARSFARAACRRSVSYLQNTVIVGAGHVGQLVARKVLKHPEYGLNVVGFVDDEPRELRRDLEHIALLGTSRRLPEIVSTFDVERVIVAFSSEPHERTLGVLRSLRDAEVQVDVVPRLYELVGPRATVHTLEGLPLVGVPPARLSRSSQLLKRTIDVVGASVGLVLAAPLFAYIAWRIKRDSPGPVLFRQTRLGVDMRPFTAFKFRTMRVGTSDAEHRAYIKQTMSANASTAANGLYKLQREDAVTSVGRWLRKTSLDELPQLLNVLLGDMSLVGPRPCLEYETENFAPHHFERFNVPAGITGLWQVTARANSTFGEALEMDVTYVRGWSLGLDLRLLCRTPLQLLHQKAATA
jgi:exopolysaccharide biosynthesis polyprenyl glycosylphosphotransferase